MILKKLYHPQISFEFIAYHFIFYQSLTLIRFLILSKIFCRGRFAQSTQTDCKYRSDAMQIRNGGIQNSMLRLN